MKSCCFEQQLTSGDGGWWGQLGCDQPGAESRGAQVYAAEELNGRTARTAGSANRWFMTVFQ